MTLNQKEQAEILRHLLEGGFIDEENVISWADSIIEREKEPDYEIIEISLSSKKSLTDFLTLIQNVQGEFKQATVVRKAMKQVYELLERNPELSIKVASWLYNLIIKGHINEEEFGIAPYHLDDAFELTTEEEALLRVKNYLQSQINKLSN